MTDGDADALATAARRAFVDQHADLRDGVVAAADDVVEAWAGDAVRDRERVVGPLRAAMTERGLLDRCPAALRDVVAATGYDLPADPVPEPPYVAVTGCGPMLRATLPPGRLVVTLRVFAVERDPVRYRRRRGDPVTVRLR
ncbi:MAG: hypothetical protein ABEJ08_02270 [Halobacteriaceae archaeon]